MFFQDSVNLESEIAKIDKGSPYLVMLTSEVGQQFFVVVERALFAESSNKTTVVVNLIASYFTFDIFIPSAIVYHTDFYSTLCARCCWQTKSAE